MNQKTMIFQLTCDLFLYFTFSVSILFFFMAWNNLPFALTPWYLQPFHYWVNLDSQPLSPPTLYSHSPCQLAYYFFAQMSFLFILLQKKGSWMWSIQINCLSIRTLKEIFLGPKRKISHPESFIFVLFFYVCFLTFKQFRNGCQIEN